MYLKRLEMTGFKSFASRTKIEFDKGVTAIVGPNGSGKSNIIEALRWVLGEQSAKSMRGGKMMDVIFSGTEKRKATNVAEVEAHFENVDHYLDLNVDEVVVTRRLYRNGDSDYLINGKKKRLRDVHNLFLDTGTGRNSLSIISQGRIEEIFNAKPEERRGIFEESAGVLKYKTRKFETESKLASTQDNLDRLEDIIFELNEQLIPLRAQRDVAVTFEELNNERQKLQLSVLVAKIDNNLKKYNVAKTTFSEVLDGIESVANTQKAYEENTSKLKVRRDEIESEIEDVQKQLLITTELKLNTKKQIELFDAKKASFEKTNEERVIRKQEMIVQQKRLQSDLLTNEKKLAALAEEKQILDLAVSQLTKELATFSESPEAVTDRLREKYLQVVNHEATLSNKLTKNRADAENITTRAVENNENTREMEVKLEETSNILSEHIKERMILKKDIDEILRNQEKIAIENKKKSDELTLAQQEQVSLTGELQLKKARLSSLEAIRVNYSNFYAGVQAVMKHNFSGIIGVVADLLTFEKQYAMAIDIALGTAAQNIVVEDEETARKAIHHLRDSRLGRATFLPLTTIKSRNFKNYIKVSDKKGYIGLAIDLVNFDKRLQNAISSILGTTVIVDNLKNAQQIARAMNFSVRIITLDGSQINTSGSFSGGAGKRNTTNFTNNDVVQLTQEIEQIKKVLQTQKESINILQEEQAQISLALTNLQERSEKMRFTEQELTLRIEQQTQIKNDIEEHLLLSKTTLDSDLLEQLEKSNQQIESELIEISKQKETLNTELDKVRSSAVEFNKLKEKKSEKLTVTKVKLSETTSEFRHHESEKIRLTHDLSVLDNEIELLQSTNIVLEDSVNRSQLVTQLEDAKHKLQEFDVKLVSLRFERDDLSAQMDDLEVKNNASLKLQQDLSSRHARLENEIEQLESTLKKHQIIISEEYHLSYEAAKIQVVPIENLIQAEKKLRNLERQIQALGPINTDAILQFNKVSERYNFLNTQKSDLIKAKNLLLENINEMDDEVRIRFEKTFSEIKSSFQLTFRQMFSGGDADLELTTDDLLTAGININVQPPGKKLSTLNLMSGGEKALTALALLFAILRVRTVPFVVLDEVEAALDETNVKRFGDYINNFNSSNQFIVVTHRKGTMAAADVLHGVTMLDAGISKLVSVRFEDEKENKKESA